MDQDDVNMLLKEGANKMESPNKDRFTGEVEPVFPHKDVNFKYGAPIMVFDKAGDTLVQAFFICRHKGMIIADSVPLTKEYCNVSEWEHVAEPTEANGGSSEIATMQAEIDRLINHIADFEKVFTEREQEEYENKSVALTEKHRSKDMDNEDGFYPEKGDWIKVSIEQDRSVAIKVLFTIYKNNRYHAVSGSGTTIISWPYAWPVEDNQ